MDLYAIRNLINSGKSIYDLPLRVTYYARVSTDDVEQLHSLTNQVSYYKELIKNNPNWTFIDGYIDEGISGKSVAKRENFQRMVEDGKLNKFDFIITKEVSRFARNTLDSIQYTQQLLSYGIGVFFQSDNINTLQPDSELRLTIMSSIAQDEIRKLSERVKFGFKRSIENGVVLGNNKIWGYKKDNGKLIIVEDEAKVIRAIFDRYANDGVGIRTLSSELAATGILTQNGKQLSFSTIRNIIKNPKYKGYYCGNKTHKVDYKLDTIKYLDESDWVVYKDYENVPPIVSEELWDKANSILSKRSSDMAADAGTSYSNSYTYSGKIICMEHNSTFWRAVYKYKSGNKEVWQCKHYLKSGVKGCRSPAIYTTELDNIMVEIFSDLAINKTDIVHKIINIYSDICSNSKIENDLAEYKTLNDTILVRKDKLLDLSIKGLISDKEFEARNMQFNAKLDENLIKIEDLKLQKEKSSGFLETINVLRNLIVEKLDSSNNINKQTINSLLDRIEVYSSDSKDSISLKVYLKLFQSPIDCVIFKDKKVKNNTSVCFPSYI